MSVIIKGMEMPKDCIDCFAETYNECMATGKMVNSIGRPDWCPLVEISETKIDDGQVLDLDSEAVETWLKEVSNIFGVRMEE